MLSLQPDTVTSYHDVRLESEQLVILSKDKDQEFGNN